MIRSYSIIGLLYLLMFSSMDWGRTGHQVVGALAQQYLTPKAHKEVEGLLDGVSLASISNCGDKIKSDPKYHALAFYINYLLKSLCQCKKSQGRCGDSHQKCIVKVKIEKRQGGMPHLNYGSFIGDLNGHARERKEDRGGNDIRLQWLNDSPTFINCGTVI